MHDRFFKTLLGLLLFFLTLNKLSNFCIVHLRTTFLACLLTTIWLFIFQKKCSFPLSEACVVWCATGCRLVLAEVRFRVLGLCADRPWLLVFNRHVATTHHIRANQPVFNVTPNLFTYFLLKLSQFKHTIPLSTCASPPAAVQNIRKQTSLILDLIWFVALLFDSSAEHHVVDVDLTDARFASLFFVLLLEHIFDFSLVVHIIFLFTLRCLFLLFSKKFL